MPDTEKNKNENGSKLSLELIPCSRCGNPFFRDPNSEGDDVCENCIKLEQRKRQLQLGVFDKVIEVENAMEQSINEMKNQLTVSRGKFNKDFFLKKIKNRSQALNKSIELIEKIEETNDEKYIEEYKALFEEMKKKYS
ncbi:MAG: hypothetical protein BAJALOKI3v1_480028 [Promethearchaeota archaeon]|jgi:uncharacterized Zn finger protein (UPF0148 family)|nr:MAG: hypothetical protein BAJALOKI3v1_480028 [Candidatus Lokiarchaeota archaeon]